MHLDIRHVNLQVSDALQEFARRHVERALRPFMRNVQRVDVRIQDINGPRGGVDKQCTITAELFTSKRTVVVKDSRANAYEAVQAACSRLGEGVSRELERRRDLDRFGAPPPAMDATSPQEIGGQETGGQDTGPLGDGAGRIQVTTLDHQRLRSLVDTWSGTRDSDAAEALADELDRAEVVPPEKIAGNVVTMNSQVLFEDQETGAAQQVSLVYPHDSDPEHGRISVLAPVGSALLGLSVGQTIDWPLPRGEVKRLRIVKLVYQPEEAGHLHL